MERYKKWILFISLFILSSFISYWLYMEIFFFYSASIFGELYTYLYGEYWVPLTMIFIISFFLSTFLYQLVTKKFNMKWIKLFYFSYSLFMMYFLLFKSIGIQGIELNPISFITDMFYGDIFIVLFNIIMFIPLGFALNLTKKNMIFILFCLLLVETIQFIFHLGFFDLSDIVTNFIGYLLGTLIAQNKLFEKNIKNKIFYPLEYTTKQKHTDQISLCVFVGLHTK